jgi:putative hydrolase of the HAD superfamily
MIKAIFFDFDGVLTTDSQSSFSTASFVEQKIGVSKEKFLECYRKFREDFNINADKRYQEIWGSICTCLGKDFGIEVLFEAFRQTPKNYEVLDLIRELRKNYKVGIITDNTKERFAVLRDEFSLDEGFDALTLSADVGSEKSAQNIFLAALQSLGVEARESVFIDNYKENLIVPKEMGFQTYYFDTKKNDVAALVEQLREWKIKI